MILTILGGVLVKKALKYIGIALGVFILIAGIWVTDNFIYPFKADTPNYSDVEKAFAKLQFPADWKEISRSENKGLHGRGCDPLNDAGCFSKGKTFKVESVNSAKPTVKDILTSNGLCSSVIETTFPEGNSSTDPLTGTNIQCQNVPGVLYTVSISQKRSEVSVLATSRF